MKPNNVLTLGYLTKYPDNAARVLESLPPPMTADLLENLSPEKYLPTFEFLIPSYAARLFETLSEDARNKLISVLSVEKLSILLIFLKDSDQKNILSQLASEKRKKVFSRMQYPSGTVGSIMKPPSFTVPQDISVAEVLKRIRTSKIFQFSEVIVLDKDLRYIGMISLGKLIQAPPHKKLNSITIRKIAALPARKSLQNLAENPAWAANLVLPVTDVRGLLIGVLDFKTLLQHKTLEIPQIKFHQAKKTSALELFFQTLAVPIEALAIKLFPFDRDNTTRNR